MTKKIPGPFAPPDLNRPSLMKPFLESNVLFNNPVILYTSQIKVRATPDHNHKFLPKDDCSLVLLNHLKQTQSKIGRWYKVKIYLFVVVVLKIKTLRQVQSEKGRKRRMRDREREARTKPKMPLPSSSSSTSSLIDNPFLTSSSLRSRFSSGWKLWSAQDKWRLAETNGGYNVSGRYSYVNGEPVLLSDISYLANPHASHSLLRPSILILECFLTDAHPRRIWGNGLFLPSSFHLNASSFHLNSSSFNKWLAVTKLPLLAIAFQQLTHPLRW